jgi:hypothetical protein
MARPESSFSHLESLERHVGTEGSGSSDEDIAISRAVSKVLQCGTNLKKVRVALRRSSWDLEHTLLYHDPSSSRRRLSPNSQQVHGLSLAPRNLFGGLIDSHALGRLQALYLTVITVERHLCALLSQLHSLRHLALRYIHLLPVGGVWESMFQLICTSLRLESADLVWSEDDVGEYPRLLLQSEASVWNSTTTTREHYCINCTRVLFSISCCAGLHHYHRSARHNSFIGTTDVYRTGNLGLRLLKKFGQNNRRLPQNYWWRHPQKKHNCSGKLKVITVATLTSNGASGPV